MTIDTLDRHPRLVQIFLNLFSSSSESSVTRSSVLSPSGSPQSATYKPTLGPSYRASLPPKYRGTCVFNSYLMSIITSTSLICHYLTNLSFSGFALSPRRTPLKHHRRKRNALPPASFAPSHDQGMNFDYLDQKCSLISSSQVS